jgi:hypothetical protein
MEWAGFVATLVTLAALGAWAAAVAWRGLRRRER